MVGDAIRESIASIAPMDRAVYIYIYTYIHIY